MARPALSPLVAKVAAAFAPPFPAGKFVGNSVVHLGAVKPGEVRDAGHGWEGSKPGNLRWLTVAAASPDADAPEVEFDVPDGVEYARIDALLSASPRGLSYRGVVAAGSAPHLHVRFPKGAEPGTIITVTEYEAP